jgi:hypothetical protein
MVTSSFFHIYSFAKILNGNKNDKNAKLQNASFDFRFLRKI